jgi:hypothetical protein
LPFPVYPFPCTALSPSIPDVNIITNSQIPDS